MLEIKQMNGGRKELFNFLKYKQILKNMDEFIELLKLQISKGDIGLKPTQDKLSVPLLYRIYKKMKAGLRNFDAIKVA